MIDSISAKWNDATTGEKAAMVGGAAAAATGIVATGYAAYHGKVDGNSIKDVFTKEGVAPGVTNKLSKTKDAMVDGYKKFWNATGKKVVDAVKNFFGSSKAKAEDAAEATNPPIQALGSGQSA